MLSGAVTVLMGGEVAAKISLGGKGGGALRYDDAYRSSSGAVPLSLSLPMTVRNHSPEATTTWISGLLPDNPRVLARWYAAEGVSPPTPLALLATRVGRDCAGAVQFVPEGAEAEVVGRGGSLKRLSDSDMAEEMRRMASDLSYWLPDTEEAYFSLGGYQAKTALHLLGDGTWARPSGSTPTTHIFKPSPTTQSEMAAIEHVCLDTARRLGLNAADSTLEVYGDVKVCVVRRYDRRRSGDEWKRVHQEDACQALGIHPHLKYEAQGGPGIAPIGDLTRRSSTMPKEDAEAFRDALLYYWLIVNRDAHARNYSFLIEPSGVRLAPIYDPGTVLPGARRRIGSYEMAMRFGRDFTVYRSHAKDSLSTLSAYLRLNHNDTLNRAEELAATIGTCAADSVAALPVEHQTPPLERMLSRLDKRTAECLKTVKAARGIIFPTSRSNRGKPLSGDPAVSGSDILPQSQSGQQGKARCEHRSARTGKQCVTGAGHKSPHRYKR